MPSGTAVRALVLSCHPVPSAAVTVLATGLAVLADLPASRVALVALAVLAGQLSIGWGNDYLDADRDRIAARADKPLAAGDLGRRAIGVAAVVATAAAVVLSALLGLPGAAAALLIVACGWAYNVGAKATPFSWLPYAVAFGALPVVATASAAPPRWPAAWAPAAGALLGVAAHFANTLPDLLEDAATGVRGLPHRLGARATAVAGAGMLLAASVVILLGPPGPPSTWQWIGFAVAAAVGGTAATVAYRDPSSRRYFQAIIAVAVLDVLLFAVSGTRL